MFSKYKYVYTVYKEQSFTKAAQKLFISQPSLSVAIKNTEKKIGAPVFERTGVGISLTEVGKSYIEACENMLRSEKEFERRLYDIYNLNSGHISVGGSNYLSSYVLPKVINDFCKLYPNIEVTLTEAHSIAMAQMIKDDVIDIMVDSFDRVDDAYELYPLVKERTFLCVPWDNPINQKLAKYIIPAMDICENKLDYSQAPTVPMQMFKDEKFIILKSGNDMHRRAMDIFAESHIMPDVALFVDQLNISYAVSQSGMGLCFVTDTILRYMKAYDEVALYNIDTKHAERTLYMGYKKGRYVTNAMKEFINIAKNTVK